MLGASAHAAELMVKKTVPMISIRRRPLTSATCPKGMENMAVASVYDVMTHVTAVAPQLNSVLIAGMHRFNDEDINGDMKPVSMHTSTAKTCCGFIWRTPPDLSFFADTDQHLALWLQNPD